MKEESRPCEVRRLGKNRMQKGPLLDILARPVLCYPTLLLLLPLLFPQDKVAENSTEKGSKNYEQNAYYIIRIGFEAATVNPWASR